MYTLFVSIRNKNQLLIEVVRKEWKSHIELRTCFCVPWKRKNFFPACEERLGEAIRVLKDLLLKMPTSCGHFRSQYVLYKRATRNYTASNFGSTGLLVSALQQDGKLLQRHVVNRKVVFLFKDRLYFDCDTSHEEKVDCFFKDT